MFIRLFKTALPIYILLIFLSWRCTKIDTTNLGGNLIPPVDNIHTFDTTLSVIANNFDTGVCDSVYRTDLHALGFINNDPFFGKTTASMYFEMKPQYFPFAFPAAGKDSLLLDSAVLILHYSSTYGDTLTPQKVLVYKLNDAFSRDTTYTTCNVFNYNSSEVIGEQTFIPARLTDSIHARAEDSKNQLRIRLSDAFANTFISDSSVIFGSDSTFKIFFKGFALIADQMFGGNAINYFDLGNADTRLSFYLRSTLNGVKDTTRIDFPFTVYSGEANSVVRERGTSEISGNLTHPATGDSILYVQTSPGSYAELKIPGLTGLSNRVIHRAELIVDQVYSGLPSDKYLTTPDYLYLDMRDTSINAGYRPIPCDFKTSSGSPNFSYFGGTRKIINDGSGHPVSEYVFNISRYVQSIVTKGAKNATLRLSSPYSITNSISIVDDCGNAVAPFNFPLNNIADGGVKLNGTNNTSTRIRLHIIYSTL
ncbi:MAG TPA: DUF4270 family protein [Ginsengibacter sp.]|nr:DUF4270 family protein [Ginsengibacter sp.]